MVDRLVISFPFFFQSPPNPNIVLAPSMSTQLATPLAVRVLELSQSELDAAAKGRGKKGEEFKVCDGLCASSPKRLHTCFLFLSGRLSKFIWFHAAGPV